MTIRIPTRVARYDISEIFDLLNSDKVQTEEDARIVLSSYKTPELMWFLRTMYAPDVKWKFGTTLPRWKPSTHIRGNTYSTLFHQLSRFESLIVGQGTEMTDKKAREVFLNAMEVIHADEARWVGHLVRGNAEKKIKFMSRDLVNRTFVGLIKT